MAAPLRLHFSPCCVSLCLLRSTFLWKPLPQRSQPNGLYPVCFLLCVMRLELWLNAFPHTWHLCGFSPEKHKWGNIFFLSLGLHVIQHQLRLFIMFTTDFHGLLRTIYAQVIYFPLDAATTIPLQICLFSTCLCGWKCASSCLTSGGTSSRSTGRGTAECRSGWAGASTGLTTFWNFCRIFCSRNFFPENVNRCGVFFFLVCFVLSHDFKSAQPALTEKQTWWQQDAASEKKVWTAGCGLKKKNKTKEECVMLPASAPLCVVPGWLRVRRFCRTFRTQTAWCRCAICGRGPPTRAEWKTPGGEKRNELWTFLRKKKTKKQDLLKKSTKKQNKKNVIVYWFHFENLFKIRRSEVNYRAIQSLVKGHFRSVCYLKVTLKAGNISVFLYEWPSPEVQILC